MGCGGASASLQDLAWALLLPCETPTSSHVDDVPGRWQRERWRETQAETVLATEALRQRGESGVWRSRDEPAGPALGVCSGLRGWNVIARW